MRSEFELFAGTLNLPGRKTAPVRLTAGAQSAIGLGYVCRDSEHGVIDEQLIGLARPVQRVQERHSKMTNDRVVLADAGLIGEFTDAFCAALSGDASKCRTRQVEENRVIRLVDDETRIALQVV